jgi:hypothetical protein
MTRWWETAAVWHLWHLRFEGRTPPPHARNEGECEQRQAQTFNSDAFEQQALVAQPHTLPGGQEALWSGEEEGSASEERTAHAITPTKTIPAFTTGWHISCLWLLLPAESDRRSRPWLLQAKRLGNATSSMKDAVRDVVRGIADKRPL